MLAKDTFNLVNPRSMIRIKRQKGFAVELEFCNFCMQASHVGSCKRMQLASHIVQACIHRCRSVPKPAGIQEIQPRAKAKFTNDEIVPPKILPALRELIAFKKNMRT